MVEMIYEMILISYTVTDEDGSLKIKQFENFADSKTYSDLFKTVAEAKVRRERSASYAA